MTAANNKTHTVKGKEKKRKKKHTDVFLPLTVITASVMLAASHIIISSEEMNE